MPIETATYISDLNVTYPVGATDLRSTLDDHIRLIKSSVKTTFPNITGAVTPTHTQLNYVSGVTSAIQTQLDAKQATVTGGATTIVSSDLTASRALASNASGKVAVSAVTATELGYVSGVTSALQTQLDAKQATITGAATTIVSSDLTASRALIAGTGGKVEVSAVTSTELGYVSGVTSAVQTQINTKQATITGGATTITSSDLTASRALTSNGSGKVAVSSVTSTELGYVSGVTSAIQTQIDSIAGRRGALVYEGSQSIANETYVTLTFGSEDYDTDSIHSVVTNTGRLTVPSGVTKVRLSGFGEIAQHNTGDRYMVLNKNGSSTYNGALRYSAIATVDNRTGLMLTSPILSVTAGDYFELVVWQNSLTSLTIYSEWFSMEIVE